MLLGTPTPTQSEAKKAILSFQVTFHTFFFSSHLLTLSLHLVFILLSCYVTNFFQDLSKGRRVIRKPGELKIIKRLSPLSQTFVKVNHS